MWKSYRDFYGDLNVGQWGISGDENSFVQDEIVLVLEGYHLCADNLET